MGIDVLLDFPGQFETLWNNKEKRAVDGIGIYLVAVSDLISLKQYANRIQDRKDVLLLSKLLRK
jgi:hypothetical protein